ncbi:aminotransferase class III-fold pyridoxal phosphate-dependent enzyme [Streptomyces sp. NPDC087851]|uniref:aminotransferase class III-fold pyridoxal phosphate-dependent enzyme n=1 Tax=Streptomyces sp. NPDC087851 TaxID=3365810 RepID=UPI0037F22623
MAVTEPAPAAPTVAHAGLLRRQTPRETSARTYARSLPVVPVRARGLTIEGADGRRYLDCLSGAGTLALGHNHPVVLEAIRKVLDSGAPLHVPDLATPVKDAFTAELLATLPAGFAAGARVRFCGPTAADAVGSALALARTATGRDGALTFTGTDHDAWTAELSDARGGPAAPAAMILEPVQDEGGVVPAPDAWLRGMRRITADRSIPLIVDETRTGVGRTGAFWAVEHSGITPDAMVMSQAIGGSLPLAVIVHHADLDAPLPDGRTDAFRGNQLAMAAGAATLAYVRQHRLAERAAHLGAHLLGQLAELTAHHPRVGAVRGRGLMIGVELVAPAAGDPAPPAPALAAAVQQECLRRGLIVGLGGREASVVRLLPPLTLTDEQADAVLDRFADALDAALATAERPAPREEAAARREEAAAPRQEAAARRGAAAGPRRKETGPPR